MARIFSIIAAFLFAAVSLNAAGQAPRPMFPRSQPQPSTQPSQANPQPRQVTPQQQSPVTNTNNPATPPTAPLKPPASADPAANVPATPVTPPVITYRDGLLTVQATNSTLGAVLNAIRNKAGIEFEGLEGGGEHVALSAGPAPAGDVLSTILQGSKFSFVAIGRADNPAIVQRVILTPKGAGAPGAVAGTVQQPQPRPNNNGEGNGDDEDTNPDEQVNVEPQDTPVQPPPVQQAQPQPQEQPQQNQQPKTPEQLFQELQQMKQQQMQQEGAPPPNPNSVPRKPPL